MCSACSDRFICTSSSAAAVSRPILPSSSRACSKFNHGKHLPVADRKCSARGFPRRRSAFWHTAKAQGRRFSQQIRCIVPAGKQHCQNGTAPCALPGVPRHSRFQDNRRTGDAYFLTAVLPRHAVTDAIEADHTVARDAPRLSAVFVQRLLWRQILQVFLFQFLQ